jgi:hypothetical protein
MPGESQTEPELRFKLQAGHVITVPCSIGADAKLSCLVDTGTWPTIVDRSCAARHGLGVDRRDKVSMIDRVVPVSAAVLPRLGLGERTIESLPVSVNDLSDLRTGIGLRADVILGLDVLRRCNLCLDFDSRSASFSVESSLTWSAPMLDCGPDPIVVEAEVDRVPVRLLVDTGAAGMVLFLDQLKERLQADATGAGVLNQFAKRLAVLGIPIHEQALVAQESIHGVGEVAADLHHPGFGGMAGAAGRDQERQLPRLQDRLHIPRDAV